MWKCDLMELLKQWSDNLLIDNIRLNVYGEIVLETTTHEFYIYRDNKIVKFKNQEGRGTPLLFFVVIVSQVKQRSQKLSRVPR